VSSSATSVALGEQRDLLREALRVDLHTLRQLGDALRPAAWCSLTAWGAST